MCLGKFLGAPGAALPASPHLTHPAVAVLLREPSLERALAKLRSGDVAKQVAASTPAAPAAAQGIAAPVGVADRHNGGAAAAAEPQCNGTVSSEVQSPEIVPPKGTVAWPPRRVPRKTLPRRWAEWPPGSSRFAIVLSTDNFPPLIRIADGRGEEGPAAPPPPPPPHPPLPLPYGSRPPSDSPFRPLCSLGPRGNFCKGYDGRYRRAGRRTVAAHCLSSKTVSVTLGGDGGGDCPPAVPQLQAAAFCHELSHLATAATPWLWVTSSCCPRRPLPRRAARDQVRREGGGAGARRRALQPGVRAGED